MTSEPSIDHAGPVARSDGSDAAPEAPTRPDPAGVAPERLETRPRSAGPRRGRPSPGAGKRSDKGPDRGADQSRDKGADTGPDAGGLGSLATRALAVWRRSLPTRVVITTLTGSLLVLLIGGVILMQIASLRVVGAKEESADNLAANSFRNAQESLDITQFGTSTTPETAVRELAGSLARQGNNGELFDVIQLGPTSVGNNVPQRGALAASLPTDLRDTVTNRSGVWSSPMEIEYPGGSTAPGYAVGTRLELPGNLKSQLYLVFPLDVEQQTLGSLRFAVVVAGLVLAALLTGIAFLVSRQTVSPVRAARVTAQSIAAGNLGDRMAVRGTDDFASLAVALNEMAAELQTQIVRLEDLSAMQQRFVSDVSHELRTPLTTVRMAADLIHEGRDDLDPLVRRSAELLQSELDRFESLLTDLLEISRFDAGAAALSVEPVDLSGVARRTIAAYEGFAASRGIDVRLRAEPEAVEGDSRRIERIVRNLLSNALEHGEGRPVEVVVAGTDQAAAIAVRDHGVGFEPEHADQVFHRFWRADPSRARTIGGSGLGLAIAVEDAKLHGGELVAWGRPGEGAQFTLTLPRTIGSTWDGAPLAPTPADWTASGDETGDGRGEPGEPT